MKNIFLYNIIILLIFTSCENNSDTHSILIPRNTSIPPQAFYNTLSLDSNAMEVFIIEQEFNDTLANGMRNFYNIRNYQYAWIAPNGFTEQTLAFRNLYDYELDSINRKKLDDQLDHWITQGDFQVSAANSNFRKMELSLTWRYLNYLLIRNDDLFSKDSYLPFPIQQKTIDSAIVYIRNNDSKNSLVKEMVRWNDNKFKKIAIPAISKTLPLSKSDTIISFVKKNLSNFYGYDPKDTSNVYSNDFINYLKKIHASFGYNDSLITPKLIQSLNVSVDERLSQMLVNYERMKWLPAMKPGRQIIVNIPSFILTAYNDQKNEFDMNVVVGKEGSSTVMFTGEINNIVFAPYWNIPSSIVQNEIMPAIENDKEYLLKNQMEIVSEDKEIPVIRQLPGEHNALGKVKFLFPNSYSIYLHDTPNKDVFKRNQRALSHGCIRVENPIKLAQWVMTNDTEWTNEKIDSAMNSEKEKWVKVNPTIPVMIYYLTSFIDSNNIINFRDDIYGHDKKFISKLISN